MNDQKREGHGLLLKMNLLKAYFGISHRQVYEKARVSEVHGNRTLHGRPGKPTLLKIEKAVFHLSHSKKIKSIAF